MWSTDQCEELKIGNQLVAYRILYNVVILIIGLIEL